MILHVTESVSLELLQENHALALLELRNTNYNRLKIWLSWVDGMQTLADFQKYIHRCNQRCEEGLEVPLVILINGEVAGRIGLNYIDMNKTAAIGYWLGAQFEGKGVITGACRKTIEYGFSEIQLNRIEIKCGLENYRSQAIPERLGFTKEGILRQAEWINGKFIDLYLFSILKEEWVR